MVMQGFLYAGLRRWEHVPCCRADPTARIAEMGWMYRRPRPAPQGPRTLDLLVLALREPAIRYNYTQILITAFSPDLTIIRARRLQQKN